MLICLRSMLNIQKVYACVCMNDLCKPFDARIKRLKLISNLCEKNKQYLQKKICVWLLYKDLI